MMLFVASIISLSLHYVTGAPQLRLSHTGYEIISFNDQTPEDSLPVTTRLAPQNTSRYGGIGFLNLEKADATVDEEADIKPPLQQRKRHYDSQRSTPSSKASSETRGNTLVPKTNVYLAVGVPTRFDRPKESSSASSDSEVTSSSGGRKNFLEDSRREKISLWTSRSTPEERETGTPKKSSKQSVGITDGDKSSAFLDSDVDSADPKEDSRFDKITTLLVDAKSETDEKLDSNAETKVAFPTVGKLPSIQIHRQRSFYIPTKSPALFSPIYPSGFDIVTGNFARKNIVMGNEPQRSQPRNFRSQSANPTSQKSVDLDVEPRRKLIGRDISEINAGAKDFVKSYLNDRVPSILTLKNILGGVGHDIFGSPRNANNSPLSGLLPAPSGTSLYVSPLSFMLRQPFRALRPAEPHLELNAMPLIAGRVEHAHPIGDSSILHSQGRLEDVISNSVIDSPRVRQLDNYLDSKYLESKVNHRIAKPGTKVDFFKNYFGKLSVLNSRPAVRRVLVNEPARELLAQSTGAPKGSLVIDIVHEAALDDKDETVVDVDKEEAAKEVHEMQDARQASSFASPKSSCKRMKAVAPPFYQFLSKFTDIVVENALRYEAGLRGREDVRKNNLGHASGAHDFNL